MDLELIDTNGYQRNDRLPQISVYSSGAGRISRRLQDALDIDEGDELVFARPNGGGNGEAPDLMVTLIEEDASGPIGEPVKEYDDHYEIRATGLMYALGLDHKEEKYSLRVRMDQEPVIEDEMFFYPVEITTRD